MEEATIRRMGLSMAHRGPDQQGIALREGGALHHNRLAIIDVENGLQPMTREYSGHRYTIIYNGELYNTAELAAELTAQGAQFQTRCDTEVVLNAFIFWGPRCARKFNGMFAFGVFDETAQQLTLIRDRFGIKPLYYRTLGLRLIFASEIKALFQHPDIEPTLDRHGLWELLFLAPVTRIGSGLFRSVNALEPGHYLVWTDGVIRKEVYWKLEAKPFEETEAQAVANVRELLIDAIRRQMVADGPLCAFLSGGLDSTIVSSVLAEAYQQRGNRLNTYSFEYEGNRDAFHSTLFQPQSDDQFAAWVANELGTEHRTLTVNPLELADALSIATALRDFPGQADIDSSLYLYCRQVKQRHSIALTGEGADEIFGGYPWYYRPEMMERSFFPWQHDPMKRVHLFHDDLVQSRLGFEWLSDEYRTDLAACPTLRDEPPEDANARRATWLTSRYFMHSLLERKDRMSMGAGVEARVPFGDHRILEYVYNIPWSIKRKNEVEKSLLREAMSDYLPERIRTRKKSPYPKVHNPEYERIVRQRLEERMHEPTSRLASMIDRTALNQMLDAEDSTWFGQLMSRPQLIAWLLQMDWWLEHYHVRIIS